MVEFRQEMKLAVHNHLAWTFVCELKKEEVVGAVGDCIPKVEEVCKEEGGIELEGQKGSHWNWICIACWRRKMKNWRHSCCVGWKAGNS